MKNFSIGFSLIQLLFFSGCAERAQNQGNDEMSLQAASERKTSVSIVDNLFYINGAPTFPGRLWNGTTIEGLLPNSRMVQGIFDDLNSETRDKWIYPDTDTWDPDRNTEEFIQNMPLWKSYGLIGFTINLQGGSPEGYSQDQPWINSAIAPDGSLRPDYMERLEKILDKADDLGMVPILGLFYFGQDEHIEDEQAVVDGVDNAVDWLFEKGYRNILIEINNECDINYDHAILQPERVHELIDRVKSRKKDGRRFLVSTSYKGGALPLPNVLEASDFVLLHGNGVDNPERIREMVAETKKIEGYRPMPIVFNEDDHFDFDKPENNFIAATESGASWGYFDFRMADEGFEQGYQSVPVDWGVNSERKKGFFNLLKEITGGLE